MAKKQDVQLIGFSVLLGHHWACRVSAASLRKLICGLLVISGLTLLSHAIQLNSTPTTLQGVPLAAHSNRPTR